MCSGGLLYRSDITSIFGKLNEEACFVLFRLLQHFWVCFFFEKKNHFQKTIDRMTNKKEEREGRERREKREKTKKFCNQKLGLYSIGRTIKQRVTPIHQTSKTEKKRSSRNSLLQYS